MTGRTNEEKRLRIIAEYIQGKPIAEIEGNTGVTRGNIFLITKKDFGKYFPPGGVQAHREFGLIYERTEDISPSEALLGLQTSIAFAKIGLPDVKEFAENLIPLLEDKAIDRSHLGSTIKWIAATHAENPYLPLDKLGPKIEKDLETLRTLASQITTKTSELDEAERRLKSIETEIKANAEFKRVLAENQLTTDELPKIKAVLEQVKKDGGDAKKIVEKHDEIEHHKDVLSHLTKKISSLKDEELEISKRLETAQNVQEYIRIAVSFDLKPKHLDAFANQVSAIAVEKGVDKNEAVRYLLEDIIMKHYPKAIDLRQWTEEGEKELVSQRALISQFLNVTIPKEQELVARLRAKSNAMQRLSDLVDQGFSADVIVKHLEDLAGLSSVVEMMKQEISGLESSSLRLKEEIKSYGEMILLIKALRDVGMDVSKQDRLVSIIKKLAGDNATKGPAVSEKLLNDIESQYELKEGFEEGLRRIEGIERTTRESVRALENRLEDAIGKKEWSEKEILRIQDEIKEAKSFFEKPEGRLATAYLASKGKKVDISYLMDDVLWTVNVAQKRVKPNTPLSDSLKDCHKDLYDWTTMIPPGYEHELV